MDQRGERCLLFCVDSELEAERSRLSMQGGTGHVDYTWMRWAREVTGTAGGALLEQV